MFGEKSMEPFMHDSKNASWKSMSSSADRAPSVREFNLSQYGSMTSLVT